MRGARRPLQELSALIMLWTWARWPTITRHLFGSMLREIMQAMKDGRLKPLPLRIFSYKRSGERVSPHAAIKTRRQDRHSMPAKRSSQQRRWQPTETFQAMVSRAPVSAATPVI